MESVDGPVEGPPKRSWAHHRGEAEDDLDLEAADFFTDTELVTDPYQYFDTLRARCPVHPVAIQVLSR